MKVFHPRYRRARGEEKTGVLEEFCAVTGYHRKYAIQLLNRPLEEMLAVKARRRGPTYSAQAIRVLERVWKAAGYPWSERLKAMLPLWLPWARAYIRGVTPGVEAQLLRISARQIDRRLQAKKRRLGRRIYGRTKPGTLLKHHIPIKTDCWDIDEPGFAEIDLVSHSGPHAAGEFVYSLNLTDIHTTWVETHAVLGKGETGVVDALDALRCDLPFRLKGIDSDNGSEFINYHLYRYCKNHRIEFTRGRPYHKDDNAHIEQKNWTHVRKLLGWDRYDSFEVLQAMNHLYRKDLRLMMNLFQPCVKLLEKQRVGSKLIRRYGPPQTPLDRLIAYYGVRRLPPALRALIKLRERLDPFELAQSIEDQLRDIERIRTRQFRRLKRHVLSQQNGSPRGAQPPTQQHQEVAHG